MGVVAEASPRYHFPSHVSPHTSSQLQGLHPDSRRTDNETGQSHFSDVIDTVSFPPIPVPFPGSLHISPFLSGTITLPGFYPLKNMLRLRVVLYPFNPSACKARQMELCEFQASLGPRVKTLSQNTHTNNKTGVKEMAQ